LSRVGCHTGAVAATGESDLEFMPHGLPEEKDDDEDADIPNLFSDTPSEAESAATNTWHTQTTGLPRDIHSSSNSRFHNSNSRSNSSSNNSNNNNKKYNMLYYVRSSIISAVQYQQPRQTTFVIRHTSYIRVNIILCPHRTSTQTNTGIKSSKTGSHTKENLQDETKRKKERVRT